jgi:hypothetical protein
VEIEAFRCRTIGSGAVQAGEGVNLEMPSVDKLGIVGGVQRVSD